MGLLTAFRKFRYPQSTDAFNPPLHFKQLADDVDAWTGNNVSPIVTDSTDRDTRFAAPVQGMRVFRQDLGYEERYLDTYNSSSNPGGAVPAGWYPANGTLLGFQNNETGNYTLTAAAAQIPGATMSCYTPNKKCVIEAFVWMNNSASGADRWGQAQLYEDGVAIGILRTVTVPILGSLGGAGLWISLSRTPSAGVHVYTIRGLASTANAVVVLDYAITVRSIIPKA